jgi:hypothetical protein
MAQRLTTRNGSTNIPGSYPSLVAINNASNIPGGGILCLIGEADAGPHWSLESDLTQNFYRPTQFASFRQKYLTGRAVDAMFGAINPSQDPKLGGAPQAIYFIKTNNSSKAAAVLPKIGGGTYHTLADKSWGEYGNLISYASAAAQAEVAPTTGQFTLLVPNNTTDLSLRASGGAALAYQMAALDTPTTTVAGLDALAGISATGGINRSILTVAGTLAAAVSSYQLTLTRSVAWATTPTVGDTLFIPAASPVGGTHALLQPSVDAAPSQINTILKLNKSGSGGNAVTLATVADGLGAGNITVAGNAMTYHYQSGVSTVANFEAQVGAGVAVTAGLVVVTTPGTGATVLTAPGDTIAATAFHSGADENAGSYVVTAATSTTIVATKLLDASGGAGALTAPVAVPAWTVLATTDARCFSPATITLEAADPIDGVGKALEVNELTSSTGRLTDLAYQLNATKVTWIARTGVPVLLTSAAEYEVSLMDARSLDSVSEYALASGGSRAIGGNVAMTIGYAGTTGTVTITDTTLTTTVTGGSGSNLSILFKNFPTIADLVSYINTRPGYSATVALPQYGVKAPGSYKAGVDGYLDRVVGAGICSTFGEEPGRIKADAREYFEAVEGTVLVQLGETTAANIPAAAGLPDVASGFLAGGAKGGTTAAAFQAAIDAAKKLNFNFGCLLIAQDATADIADGETESSSTYVLEDVISYARAQAEALSTQFERKFRQYFAGVMGSYVSVQRPLCVRQSTKGRLALCIEDFTALGPDATSQLYQPWYGAVLAAAMQAAAFTGGIVHREPRQSGVSHRYGDFDPNNRGDVEGALDSGILVASRGPANPTAVGSQGRWTWVSDQTCYIRDNSFYANSIQAIFLGDLLQMSVALGLEDGIVGDNSSDADAPLVKKATEKLLGDALKARILTADDESPRGFSLVTAAQDGPTYTIDVTGCKLNTLIYFAAINFTVGPVVRRA